MKGKWWIAGIIGLLLLAVCGLTLLTLYGTASGMRGRGGELRLFYIAETSAQETESRTLDSWAGQRLRIDSSAGAVTVMPSQDDQVHVEMVKTAWGRDKADAQANAKAMTVSFQEKDGELAITYREPDHFYFVASRGGSDSVDFTIQAPPEVFVIVLLGNGRVELRGTAGADLGTGFGDVTVLDIDGPLTVASQHGDLEVRQIRAGDGDILLSTGFGRVAAEGLAGRSVAIKSDHGDLALAEVTATGPISLETGFGDVRLEGLHAADLSAKTENGALNLEDGEIQGTLTATTGFGDVEVGHVQAATCRLESDNGNLTLEGVGGLLELDTLFGNVLVSEAEGATLRIGSGSGRVRFSGSLNGSASHDIRTESGDITLALPAESAFDLNLETGFGRIRSDLAVTLTGDLSDDHWEARLGGGGPLLTAHTKNGDIQLLVLPPQS